MPGYFHSDLNLITFEQVGEYEYPTTDFPNKPQVFFIGCRRCGGSGHHDFDGSSSVCYLCGDSWDARLGREIGDRAAAEKHFASRSRALALRLAKKEAERQAYLAERDVAWEALKEAEPEVFNLLHEAATADQWSSGSRFIDSICGQLWSLGERPYSQKQIDAVKQIMEAKKVAEAEAEAHPVVEGRQEISGEILSAKLKETDFGMALKIVVKDARGFRVYGTMQRQIADALCVDDGDDGWLEGAKGREVKFTATVKVSDDDKAFGFFSRPVKGEVIR